MRVLSILLVVLTLLSAGCAPETNQAKGYRKILLSRRDYKYQGIGSQVITSPKQLEEFLTAFDDDPALPFLESSRHIQRELKEANVDFTMEALVLIQHTEGSGSNVARLGEPELKGEKLICTINAFYPSAGTDDFAYHCFALAVEKAKVKTVEVKLQPSTSHGLEDSKVVNVLVVSP